MLICPVGSRITMRVMPGAMDFPTASETLGLVSNSVGDRFSHSVEVYVTAKDSNGEPLTGFYRGRWVNVNTGAHYTSTDWQVTCIPLTVDLDQTTTATHPYTGARVDGVTYGNYDVT